MTSVATSEAELGLGAPAVGTESPPEVEELVPEDSDSEVAEGEPVQESLFSEDDSGIRDLDESTFSDNQVAIVDEDGLRAMGELATALSYMWVSLEPPGPQHRGRLGLYLEEAIEAQLEERGALPPGIQASTGLDASLSDQLYRARLVEMRGIAIGVPSLEGITNLGRSLDAEDSAVLRWWIAAAADRPVHLVISNENTKLRVYPSPVLFQTLFDVAPLPVTPMPPSPAMAESSESMELSDLPPEVEQTNVLGTEVATIEELHSVEALTDDQQDVAPEEEFYEDDPLMDVELPDLDRALGLAPEENEGEAARGDELVESTPRDVSPQLPLDYESPVPVAVNTQNEGDRPSMLTRIASPPPPADTVTEPPAGVELAQQDPEPVMEPELENVDAAGAEQPASFERVEASVAEEPTFAEPDSLDLGDDIDEDEFLRTLEEDSARAPEVEQAAVEPEGETGGSNDDEVVVTAEPDPLPTKKITRNPFIRMADPRDAIDSEENEASFRQAETEDESPAGDELEATLSGAAAPDPNDPFNQLASREWKTWVKNLEAARGPKPLSVIERMFVTDYTRLREAVRRGVADASANEILTEWQDSFSKSYSEAFDALRVRGKRPTMVLDIPEMAQRLGRLQGAKKVQLLLVDGLRFDLGLMVQDRLREKADASLTERLLLWSALPSVTSYQLELLGKGSDGLKQPIETEETPALVARGASARVPRRVRTGSLELYKLDVVEDCLREVGEPIIQRMDSIAEDASTAISEHLNKQPPRTMVVVFGDHGFALDPRKAGTSEEATQGGSSPEEVLVPAFAWLTGAVH